MSYSQEYKQTKEFKRKKAIWDRRYYNHHKKEILDYQTKHSKKPEVIQRRREIRGSEEYRKKRRIKRKKYRNITARYNKKWKKEHPNYEKEYYSKNRLKQIQKVRKYQKNHSKKVNETRIKRHHKRWTQEPEYKIRVLLRTALGKALKNYTQIGKIMSSRKYGINYRAIIKHLKPFPEDISNYHIDHIKPLCSFDLTNPEEVKKAFAPENHRWLLAKDNLKKSAQDKLLKNGRQ